MKVEFVIPGKAFSLNAYRYGHSPHKTKAARDFENNVLGVLKNYLPLEALAESWRKHYGTFKVIFILVYPDDIFFNAKKRVSAKTFDLSNCEKILLDLIFNRSMMVDDRFVTELTSSKIPGNRYEIQVILELNSNSNPYFTAGRNITSD